MILLSCHNDFGEIYHYDHQNNSIFVPKNGWYYTTTILLSLYYYFWEMTLVYLRMILLSPKNSTIDGIILCSPYIMILLYYYEK